MQSSKIDTVGDLCEAIAEQIGPCPRCGVVPAVIAVFPDNTSSEIVGFKVICKCDGDATKMTTLDASSLPTYNAEDLQDIYKRKFS